MLDDVVQMGFFSDDETVLLIDTGDGVCVATCT
jgi:hypothetical protein